MLLFVIIPPLGVLVCRGGGRARELEGGGVKKVKGGGGAEVYLATPPGR